MATRCYAQMGSLRLTAGRPANASKLYVGLGWMPEISKRSDGFASTFKTSYGRTYRTSRWANTIKQPLTAKIWPTCKPGLLRCSMGSGTREDGSGHRYANAAAGAGTDLRFKMMAECSGSCGRD